MKSYVRTRLGVLGRITEARNLYLGHTRNIAENVENMLGRARRFERKISLLLQAPVSGLRMLEIGPGQQLMQLAYFGAKNDVVGIDLDLIMERLNLRDCVTMARQNGWVRTAKTVGRKMLRIDHRVAQEVTRQLGLKSLPDLRVLQMNAEQMEFPDNHFDVVYSRAVFEHLPNPAAVLSEARRVLRPGGVLVLDLHLFTSDSGCHDTRIFVGDREALPFWPHLRPEHQPQVRSNSYLNRLLLADWERILHSTLSESHVSALCDAPERDREELRKLRSLGQLSDYSDQELLTVTIEADWKKPSLS